MIKLTLRIAGVLLVIYAVLVGIFYFYQRSLLYLPSHAAPSTTLAVWLDGDRPIGYCRKVPNPSSIWLMMPGNAGQAADRDYVLQRMSQNDSLYVLEYPGYGSRQGSPSLETMNQAASEAYQLLVSRNPKTPVCLLGGIDWKRSGLCPGSRENCAGKNPAGCPFRFPGESSRGTFSLSARPAHASRRLEQRGITEALYWPGRDLWCY
jgi:hypothetical protein